MTDRRRLAEGLADRASLRDCVVTQARHAVQAGIDVLQVRERDLDAGDLVSLVSDVVKLARGSRTIVLVNDRLDVALASGAGGVHLRADSATAAAVRRFTPPGFVIGRSVHSVEEAVAVESDVDYLIAGTVWPTRSKPDGHPLLGLDGLQRICSAVRIPVLAIGGITADRAAGVAGAGAAGIAGVGLFMSGSAADRAACRAIPLASIVNAVRVAFDTSGSAS